MNLHSRLMRFLGKDNPNAEFWAGSLTGIGCLELWRGMFGAEPHPGGARFGAVAILLGVLWLGWVIGYAKALKRLPVLAAMAAAFVLAFAALDRMGLSWLPLAVGTFMLIFGAIVCILALFDLIEHRFS